MSTSSQQTDSLTTSNDTITLNSVDSVSYNWYTGTGGFIAQDITTIMPSNVTAGGISGSGVSTVTITGGGVGTIIGNGSGASGTINIGTIDYPSSWNWNQEEEFVNCLPDFDRIKKMCDSYPGLKIAYEKFVTTYKLVKDDFDAPKDKK